MSRYLVPICKKMAEEGEEGVCFFSLIFWGSFPNEKQHIALTLSGHMTVSRWDWLIVVLENNTITDAQESFSHKMDLKQR